MTVTITTSRHLGVEELERIVAQLLARAAIADKRGLKKTAQSWRDTVSNLRRQQQSRESPLLAAAPNWDEREKVRVQSGCQLTFPTGRETVRRISPPPPGWMQHACDMPGNS